jgi:hypothetical protein
MDQKVDEPNLQPGGQSLEQLQVAYTSLMNEMKRTKGARFNAAKRLGQNDKRKTKNTAYATVAVIVLTLLPIMFEISRVIESAVNLATIGFSIFILVVTLLQAGDADQVKAEQFQRCALEINSLRRRLRSIDNISPQIVREFSAEYDDILKVYNINHDDIDFQTYKRDHPDEFPGKADVSRKDSSLEVALGSDAFPRFASLLTVGLFAIVFLASSGLEILNAARKILAVLGYAP